MESFADDDAYSNHFFSALLLVGLYFLGLFHGQDSLAYLDWHFYWFLRLDLCNVALVQRFFSLFGKL